MKWIPLSERRPADGQFVDWITPSGDEVANGKYVSNLWFLPSDHKVYAYYAPAFWRPTTFVAKPAPKVEGKK